MQIDLSFVKMIFDKHASTYAGEVDVNTMTFEDFVEAVKQLPEVERISIDRNP